MLPLCPKKKAAKPEQKAEVLPVFLREKKGQLVLPLWALG
jgi:hypothetical protein